MSADEPVVHLPAKDARDLLRLLSGYQALLRQGDLDERDLRLAAGGVDLQNAAEGLWRERLAHQAEVACGLLRQSLDGFDPSNLISAAQPDQGAPAVDR